MQNVNKSARLWRNKVRQKTEAKLELLAKLEAENKDLKKQLADAFESLNHIREL